MQHRAQRISEMLREELGEIIGFELSDPRLIDVAVTEVMVSPGSKHATIKVSLGGEERDQRQAMAALEHAGAFLRSELSRRLSLRQIPELHFEADHWPDAPARVELLLKRAKKKRASTENQP